MAHVCNALTTDGAGGGHVITAVPHEVTVRVAETVPRLAMASIATSGIFGFNAAACIESAVNK